MPASPKMPTPTAHFAVSGVIYQADRSAMLPAVSSVRGQELVITDHLIEVNTDRTGFCWLSLLNDPRAQVERFGQVLLVPGPPPAGMMTTEPGSADHEYARRVELDRAAALPTPAEQHAERGRIRERYGPAPQSSQTLATYGTAL